MASYARTQQLRLPSPARAALPFAALGATALGLEAERRLWLVGLGVAALFAAAGAVRAAAAARELGRVRRAADTLILRSRHAEASAVAVWRSRELTGTAERTRLHRELERTLRTLGCSRLPSASPLQRPAARANADLLRRLANRLGDERPVSPRGILTLQRLLREPSSPLYNDGADYLLPAALARTLESLEP